MLRKAERERARAAEMRESARLELEKANQQSLRAQQTEREALAVERKARAYKDLYKAKATNVTEFDPTLFYPSSGSDSSGTMDVNNRLDNVLTFASPVAGPSSPRSKYFSSLFFSTFISLLNIPLCLLFEPIFPR